MENFLSLQAGDLLRLENNDIWLEINGRCFELSVFVWLTVIFFLPSLNFGGKVSFNDRLGLYAV